MASQPSQRLAHDHAELNELLKQLQQALAGGKLEASHASLDLFWARLAVHIRAEHLHLFPAVIHRLAETANQILEPSLSEAQSTVDLLRADHDFFMHGLARAIGSLRDMLSQKNSEAVALDLTAVRDAVFEIEKRLVAHNEIEETQVYRWATCLFDEQEQLELSIRINAELAHPPARFPLATWLNGR